MNTTNNLGLNLPEGTDWADVAKLNENFEKLDAAVSAAQSADGYDASRSYAVGDYCLHDGTLYRCTTATAGEAWNAAHWAATTLAAELQALYAAVAGCAPLTHAARHASGGADPITPASIGAAASNHTHTPASIGADPSGSAAAVQANLDVHARRTDNPHGVTAAQLGAGSIVYGTYIGTGTYGSGNPTSLTFPFDPKLVIISIKGLDFYCDRGTYFQHCFLWYKGVTSISLYHSQNGGGTPITLAVSGNSLTWWHASEAQYQLNAANVTYKYIAIG